MVVLRFFVEENNFGRCIFYMRLGDNDIKKQQTVVVNYHSRAVKRGLEYKRLSFSQESFDFL